MNDEYNINHNVNNNNETIDNELDIDYVLKTPDDNETGYVVVLDLTFPIKLHDLIKEFPPCPENISVKEDWMSDYQKSLAKRYENR